jgi:hypothetical protein
MVASSLLTLWGHTCLEVEFWLAILKLLSVVVFAGLKLKVLFHHINVVFVVLFVDAGVAPDQDTELVERLSDELALLEHFCGVLLEEGANVDYRYFS